MAIQVNGKIRGEIELERGLSEDEVKKLALANERVLRHLEGKQIVKIIYVKDKLISIAAK